ncbi:hypothetical protein GUITHDRAFT_139413 [Guillardia theta CCMP2712]|uniref:AAA+ ATPase domain-containing protein n=1 Tax=Guillardia theta (strain CCMP2712) TaxID=905079 RepID=L1J8C7_GUITC|nr:hypothetical protein GUITHDRAFT_139413 [Guillardia theta CCMP2712]EKX44788.1 hypothetical protein GUITHDRAFT_139413 [Guillardia theta CCMP2712]|eukprot:XP_005831768.1 hypothetical protein GUITHDRAFT_139413 [Guillardia theta CCMP2712]
MAQDIIDHNRFVLSRVITMIESNKEEHRQKGSEVGYPDIAFWAIPDMRMKILDVALKVMKQRNYRNPARSSIRLGISGPPGVGKSTVAVIAVDPSSQISRGSILGDKTRMNDLAAHPNAYIRPCATGGSLGGLSQHTDEVVLLCETAGFDVILIETVGVGQSEVLVSEVADMFILLLPPVGGDELQGIKRGIMEAADLIVINKADGDLKLLAKKAQSECRSALQFLRGGAGHKWWKSDVLTCSAQTKEGVNDIMSSIETYWKLGDESGDLRLRRGKQRASWMWRKSKEDIVKMLEDCELVTKRAEELEVELRQSEKTPRWAAKELVKVFMKTGKDL